MHDTTLKTLNNIEMRISYRYITPATDFLTQYMVMTRARKHKRKKIAWLK